MGQRLLVESTLTLGRSEADVVIDDPEISRRHALVRAGSGFVEIVDLDSLNGTWVNGTRIRQSARLAPGDEIRLGQTILELEGVATSVPIPEVLPSVLALEESPSPAPSRIAVDGHCSECGNEVPPHARFCPSCGAPQPEQNAARAVAPPPASSAPELAPLPDAGFTSDDELRPVTALFADIVGSTGLGERLAPDEVKALIGECVTRMTKVVEQHGGTVQSYMGDGIAAFFGLPAAHEDDADRAAHAALRMLEVVAEYAHDIRAAWGVEEFSIRVGINSGQVGVGVVGGSDQHTVALGDTANVAARLQAIAAPSTAVVGETTARLLAHRFVLESLGDVTVKGRTQPVGAWRLVRFQPESVAPAPTPLVGREAEVTRLRGALDELRAGRGQALMIVGDSGFGKSRLLRELETLTDDHLTWVEAHCRSFGGELLYWPFVEALRRWIGVGPEEPEVSVRTKLRARLAGLPGLDPAEVLPGLARLLSIHVDAEPVAAASDPEESAVSNEATSAFCRWVEALCIQGPVVLAIDDLHYADSRTNDVVEALLEVTEREPLLLATAFRADPGAEGSRFRLYALEHYAHRVVDMPIGPLSEAASEELLAMLMPEGLEDASRRELVARAEGNPLYLEELLRSLLEKGGLERRQRTWALTVVPGATLPPALEALLISRFDDLPEDARRLAQVAAVIGRTFPSNTLELLIPSEVFPEALSALVRGQFVRELHRYPQLVYTFKHGLMQEAALSTLPPSRRQELYGRVAAAFEQLYEDSRDEHLELLASYYVRSLDFAKAREYLELAGVRAASLDATEHARELWTRAKDLAVRVSDHEAEERIATRLAELQQD